METSEVERQRQWHLQARTGDRTALAALYGSMLPLLKSRVKRVLERFGSQLGGWYSAEDVVQDAFVVFHGFVASCDPAEPLYRLIAGAFERALAGYVWRRAAGARAAFQVELDVRDHDDREGPNLPGRCVSGYEQACAEALLAALPRPSDRALAALLACGWSPEELGRALGCSAATIRYRRRRMRATLAGMAPGGAGGLS